MKTLTYSYEAKHASIIWPSNSAKYLAKRLVSGLHRKDFYTMRAGALFKELRTGNNCLSMDEWVNCGISHNKILLSNKNEQIVY